MKEHPTLFIAPMVSSILAGNKTQTRRLAPVNKLTLEQLGNGMTSWSIHFSKPVNGVMASHSAAKISENKVMELLASMYSKWKVGDRLWVKETFCDATSAAAGRILYRADGDKCCKWTPSIFMPRSASRINLRVTNVRLERLRDISAQDALSEGVTVFNKENDPVKEYSYLWENINGLGTWSVNSFVWVIEFEREAV